MKNNFLMSVAESIDDFVAGRSAHTHCQWRGAVVPNTRLTSDHISEALKDSHVISTTERGMAEETSSAPFPEPFTLEMADGTLVSFFLIRGSRTNMETNDYGAKAKLLSQKLAGYMNSGREDSYSFGIYFLHDPHTAQQVFDQKVAPLLATAVRLGGDPTRLRNDMRGVMVQGAAEEMTLMTVRTHRAILRADEQKEATKEYRDLIGRIMKSGQGIKGMSRAISSPFGQILLCRSARTLQAHEGMVMTILADLNSRMIGISAILLSVGDAFERIRRFADREIPNDPKWRPRLMGQHGSMRTAETMDNPVPTPLALGMQVLSRKIIGHIDAHELSTIGHTWYGTSVVVEGPISPVNNPNLTTFAQLMEKVTKIRMPFCMSFEIWPNGLKYNRLNQAFNTFLGAIGAHNRQIRVAYKELREHHESEGTTNPVVAIRLTCSTWAKDRTKAEGALLEMNLALNGWGQTVASSESGAPDFARLSAIPEYLKASHAPMMPAPLDEAIFMSPIMRQASPWDDGQLLLKKNDGVIYPIGVGTKLQLSYVTGVVAPSGSGKSFWMNTMHTRLALSPGSTKIPYLCVIDVAPSSVGTMRELRTILPESMHQQMVYFKVINSADYCVNPWDLQLGCFEQVGPERDFLTSVFEIVFNSIDEAERGQFISMLITAAYKRYAPGATTARIWQRGNHEKISGKLDEIGFDFESRPHTVWEVTRALFSPNDPERIVLARMAQRYAVPRMEDLAEVMSSPVIMNRYGTAKVANGELLLEVANRNLLAAVDQYPLLSSITQTDLDNSRICVIDLQNVLGNSSDSGRQFSAMMYLYARHLGARNYFLDEDEVRVVCMPEFLDYQMERVREIRQTPKILTYDEWHNVKLVKGMLALNIKEGRETRKYRVFVNYVSQYFPDFPEEMMSGMTSMYCVGQASPSDIAYAQKHLDLSDTDVNILKTGIAGKMGRLWAWFKLVEGPVTAVLNNDVGPLAKWCYTTDDKDAPLRAELVRLIGETEALVYLSQVFPTGSASQYLDRRMRELDAENFDKNTTMTVIVAREMARKFNDDARLAVAN